VVRAYEPAGALELAARLRAAGCVFAEDELAILTAAAKSPHELATMVERRVGGEPIEHIVGWAEFCGLRVAVEPGVFVPRRRTEFLVEQAAALLPPKAVVLDLCCGAGAIGAALLARSLDISLYAADVDPAAVACARRNLAAPVYEGDLYEPLPPTLRGIVDVIVANVPYVPTDDVPFLPSEARDHEPLTALDGGADGLAVLRRVAAEAPRWLRPGGHLLIETSERQVAAAVAAFASSGFRTRTAADDERRATVVVGTAA
jgi:release factor glutamine methyltransferase